MNQTAFVFSIMPSLIDMHFIYCSNFFQHISTLFFSYLSHFNGYSFSTSAVLVQYSIEAVSTLSYCMENAYL